VEHLWEKYTPASRRLVDAMFDGGEPAADDLATVRHTLQVYLASLGADAETRGDIVQDTLVLLISAIRRGAVDPEGNVAAYIRTIALNCWRDLGRYRARRPVLDPAGLPEPVSDDEVARLLDALTSAERVSEALAAASSGGDPQLAAFISDWLAIAQRRGGPLPLRDAAKALGTNPVHVQRQLARFARYLE
jgi:DNA-directed RNA polymerase specialized sigma24 family protein